MALCHQSGSKNRIFLDLFEKKIKIFHKLWQERLLYVFISAVQMVKLCWFEKCTFINNHRIIISHKSNSFGHFAFISCRSFSEPNPSFFRANLEIRKCYYKTESNAVKTNCIDILGSPISLVGPVSPILKVSPIKTVRSVSLVLPVLSVLSK